MYFLCKIVMYNKAQRPTQRKAEAANGAPAWSWLTLLAHAAFSFSFTLRRLMSRFIARKQSSAPASATFLKKCTCMTKHREGNAESQSNVHSENKHADTLRFVVTRLVHERLWRRRIGGSPEVVHDGADDHEEHQLRGAKHAAPRHVSATCGTAIAASSVAASSVASRRRQLRHRSTAATAVVAPSCSGGGPRCGRPVHEVALRRRWQKPQGFCGSAPRPHGGARTSICAPSSLPRMNSTAPTPSRAHAMAR